MRQRIVRKDTNEIKPETKKDLESSIYNKKYSLSILFLYILGIIARLVQQSNKRQRISQIQSIQSTSPINSMERLYEGLYLYDSGFSPISTGSYTNTASMLYLQYPIYKILKNYSWIWYIIYIQQQTLIMYCLYTLSYWYIYNPINIYKNQEKLIKQKDDNQDIENNILNETILYTFKQIDSNTIHIQSRTTLGLIISLFYWLNPWSICSFIQLCPNILWHTALIITLNILLYIPSNFISFNLQFNYLLFTLAVLQEPHLQITCIIPYTNCIIYIYNNNAIRWYHYLIKIFIIIGFIIYSIILLHYTIGFTNDYYTYYKSYIYPEIYPTYSIQWYSLAALSLKYKETFTKIFYTPLICISIMLLRLSHLPFFILSVMIFITCYIRPYVVFTDIIFGTLILSLQAPLFMHYLHPIFYLIFLSYFFFQILFYTYLYFWQEFMETSYNTSFSFVFASITALNIDTALILRSTRRFSILHEIKYT